MSESKLEQYKRQSEQARADIATWPKWMQRNLRPPTTARYCRDCDQPWPCQPARDFGHVPR